MKLAMYDNLENNLELLDFIGENNTRDELSKFSGEDKQSYKILILKAFCHAWLNDVSLFHDAVLNINLMLHFRDGDYHRLREERFMEKKKQWSNYLYERGFKFIGKINDDLTIDDSILQKGIDFCRAYYTGYRKSNQIMYTYNLIREFWDIEMLYRKKTTVKNLKLLACSWIDLTPFTYKVPVYTFPDYIAYQDMINMWNDVVVKGEEVLKNPNSTERNSLLYSLSSSMKYSIVSAVHFVEIYLFYFYYLCKLEGEFTGNTLIQSNRLRTISDKQIITQLLFEEYSGAKDNLNEYYEKYLKVLEIRDAIVHLSPFQDEQLKKSRIELTMYFDIQTVAEYLTTCYEFVVEINTIVDFELLFWHQYMDKPDFKSLTKISNLNITRNQ